MTGPSITEFLLARIEEDETTAKAATPGPWTLYNRGVGWEIPELPEVHDGLTFSRADAHHVARHDPARVLAECAAKRRMLAKIPKLTDAYDQLGGTSLYVLQCLAAVYKDHADYQEEWAA